MSLKTPSHILCFDFDGTLINHSAEPRFSPAMRDRLMSMRARGAVFVINTGRTVNELLQGITGYGVFMLPDYVVAQETELYRPDGLGHWVDLGDWNRRGRKIHTDFLRTHTRFFDWLNRELKAKTKAQLIQDSGQIGIVASTEEEMAAICEAIRPFHSQFPDLGFHRNGVYMRFTHVGRNKGTSLAELARLLEVPLPKIFAGGDNFNDLAMLHPDYAGAFACPSNAVPEIRLHVEAMGGFAADRPASEGMLQALDHYFPEADPEG